MKTWMIAAPMALLLATTALAQTTDPAAAPESSGAYGSDWPDAVGSAFMTMTDNVATLRTDEELTAAWASLTDADREVVKADCTAFQADVAAGTAAGAEATGTMTDDSTTGSSADGGTSGDAAPKMALSVEDMTRLCTRVMGM